MPTGLISEEIIRALADEGYGVTKRYINMCLDKKYKTKLQNIEQKELGNNSENDNKNAPEQTILVDNTGYEEAFEDIDRPNVITESERVKKIEKRIDELAIENEILKREILKEKTKPELLLELQENFYDGSGLLDVKAMDKISEEAGRDIETMLKKYNGRIQVAVESGHPVPVGTYLIAKPNMKLVPIRITVDFYKKKIELSLWQEKLQSLNI